MSFPKSSVLVLGLIDAFQAKIMVSPRSTTIHHEASQYTKKHHNTPEHKFHEQCVFAAVLESVSLFTDV